MRIKVLLVMPEKEVQLVKIPASMKFIKAFIGENLLRIKVNKNAVIYANNNADITDFNRIYKGNILLGNFIIVSIKNNRRVSIKRKDIIKYTNIFKLRKHKRKIEICKDEFLERYYYEQRKMKLKNAKENKGKIFNIAA